VPYPNRNLTTCGSRLMLQESCFGDQTQRAALQQFEVWVLQLPSFFRPEGALTD